jgi:hypothetical protein
VRRQEKIWKEKLERRERERKKEMKRRKRKWVELANQPPLSSPKCERARDDKIDELGALYILEKLKEAKEKEKKKE